MFKPLRDKILELAITGKLVPQLESEPAVEQIGPAPAQDEVPFELPNNWKLVYLSEIATLINGRAYSKNELLEKREGLTPIVRVGNFFTNSKYFYSDLKLDEKNYCEKGDLLFAWSASFGPKLWDGPRSIFHYHIWKVLCSQHVDKLWLFYWFWAKTQELKDASHGTTMVHITKAFMESNVVALPPLEEQRRIVSKLDDIMGNLERMDQAYTELSGSMAKHFKNLVLQQAISGQLVPQLDSEPAVEQIGPAPAKDDVPFALPEKWKWIQVGELVSFINGDRGKNYPSKDKLTKDDTGYPFVSALNLEHNTISSRSLLFLTKEQCIALRSGHIISGDFLLCIRGSLGKFAIAQRSGGAIASSLVILRLNADSLINSRYLQAWLQSGFFMKLLQDAQNSTCQPNIGAKQVASFIVPLPPIEEQRRIVARIEELFGDVDKLLEWQQFA